MSTYDQLIAEKKALELKIANAMETQRPEIIKDIKEKIIAFKLKAIDFKGCFETRITQKQVEEYLISKGHDDWVKVLQKDKQDLKQTKAKKSSKS